MYLITALDDYDECEGYSLTTTAELTDADYEEKENEKRKKKKFADFVTESTDSEMQESGKGMCTTSA